MEVSTEYGGESEAAGYAGLGLEVPFPGSSSNITLKFWLYKMQGIRPSGNKEEFKKGQLLQSRRPNYTNSPNPKRPKIRKEGEGIKRTWPSWCLGSSYELHLSQEPTRRAKTADWLGADPRAMWTVQAHGYSSVAPCSSVPNGTHGRQAATDNGWIMSHSPFRFI